MLSKYDIEKELCKGINISPFNPNNIKENSINLSASSYAWSMANGEFILTNDGDLLEKDYLHDNKDSETITISKGKSSVITINDKDVIILLPFSTTLILTSEVIAVDNRIGGTYHSKVGLVSKGTGHIGTMLGPNFSGHSLIAVHNVSEDLLKINVGDTFVSVIFNYLNTPIESPNPTINAHLDKMSELRISLTSYDRNIINADWKSNIVLVREQMENDERFKLFKKLLLKRKIRKINNYLNMNNIIVLVVLIIIFTFFYRSATLLDKKLVNGMWVDRFWTVGFSGIFISIIGISKRFFKSYQ